MLKFQDVTEKFIFIFTVEDTLHISKNALNSAKSGNKMLPKVNVDIPLISTTESSNPLGEKYWSLMLINKKFKGDLSFEEDEFCCCCLN